MDLFEKLKPNELAAEAMEKAKGHHGQFDNAAKYIDPRQE